MRGIARRAFALLTLLGLAAVPVSTGAAETIEIHGIFATTGESGFVGAQAVRALAIEEGAINRAGGINGRPIHFVIQDDQSSAQVAVQLANQLVASGVQVMLGPFPVAACSAVAPLLRDRAVMFCLSAGYHPPPNSPFYVAGVSTTNQLIFATRYLRQRGLTKLASIAQIDANGQDFDRSMAEALKLPENRSLSLVDAEHFSINDISVDAQMARIKASGAQVLLSPNNGTPLGVILHAYTNVGANVPLILNSGALNNIAMRQFAGILPKEFLVTGSLSDGPEVAPPGPVKSAILVFEGAFKQAGIEPDHALALPWDPALIVVGALRKYGPNATAAQIDDYIHNLHGFAGINGLYDFRNGNQSGLSRDSLVMVRWDPDRKGWTAVSRPGGAPL